MVVLPAECDHLCPKSVTKKWGRGNIKSNYSGTNHRIAANYPSKCSYECAYNWVQLWYTIQHRTVLIIFTLILQTVITVQRLSAGGDGIGQTNHLWKILIVIEHFQQQIPTALTLTLEVSDWVEFNVHTIHITGHFRDKSFPPLT